MLKIQLACHGVIKASKVKSSQGGAEWVKTSLVGNSGAEWVNITAKLKEVERMGDLAAVTLDSALLDAASAAIRLVRSDPALYDGSASLCRSLSNFFIFLKKSFHAHIWKVSSLLTLLREAALLVLNKNKNWAFFFKIFSDFFVTACTVLRAGDHKAMYEAFFSKSTPSPSNLLLFTHLEAVDVLSSILFPSINEWVTFFPSSITPEEVKSIFEHGAASNPHKRRKTDDGVKKGSKKDFLSVLFTELEKEKGTTELDFKIHVVFDAFVVGIKNFDANGTVRVFFNTQSFAGNVEIEQLCYGLSVTTLRFFHRLSLIALSQGSALDVYSVNLISQLLHSLLQSKIYKSQVDVLYNSGFGLTLLNWLSDALVLSIPETNDSDSLAKKTGVVEAGLHFSQLYHKVIEEKLGRYVQFSVEINGGGRRMKAASEAFLTHIFLVYNQMQGLDVVMDGVCALMESSAKETLSEERSRFVEGLVQSTFGSVVDPSAVLQRVMERLDTIFVSQHSSDCTLAFSCRLLSATLKGLNITETSSRPVAKWVDTVLQYIGKSMLKSVGMHLMMKGDDSDTESDSEEGDAKTLGASQKALLVVLAECYYNAQSVLDAISPFFLTNDIFVWSRKMVSALCLETYEKDSVQSPLLIFPSMPELTKKCTKTLLDACFAGDELAQQFSSVAIKILRQRTLRIQTHSAVLGTLGLDSEQGGELDTIAKKLKKQMKVVSTDTLVWLAEHLRNKPTVSTPATTPKKGRKRKLDDHGAEPLFARDTALTSDLLKDLHVFADGYSAKGLAADPLVMSLVQILSLPEEQVGEQAKPVSGKVTTWGEQLLWGEVEGAGVVTVGGVGSASVLSSLFTDANWESPKLTSALLSACADILSQQIETPNLPLSRKMGSILKAFPSQCLKGCGESKSLLKTLLKCEDSINDVHLQADLRFTTSVLIEGKTELCNRVLNHLAAMVQVSDLQNESERLLRATFQLGVSCLKGADDVVKVEELSTALTKEVDKSDGEKRNGGVVVAKGLLGACLLGRGVLNVASLSFPPSCHEVADLRKKIKKRKQDSDQQNASRKALFNALQQKVPMWKLSILDAILLLTGVAENLVADDTKLLKRIKRKFESESTLTSVSKEILLTVLLEVVFEEKNFQSKTFQEQYEIVLFLIGEIEEVQIKRGVHRSHKMSFEGGIDAILLQKLSNLPKAMKRDILTTLLENVKASPRDLKNLQLFRTFVLTCPKEYTTVRDTLLSDSSTKIITEAQIFALSFDRKRIPLFFELLNCVSAIFLMEKLVIPANAFHIAFALPRLVLPLSVETDVFFELHGTVVNTLQNMVMHHVAALEFGGYLAAVGDALEGLLTFLEKRGEVVMTEGELEEDAVSSTVRLIELFAGTRKRPGVSEGVRRQVGLHSPSLLQRFLLAVVTNPSPANHHNRNLSRAFAAIMAACGKEVFSATYAALPQSCRAVAAAYHLQWQSTKFQGKT